jgi:hypothetical protein
MPEDVVFMGGTVTLAPSGSFKNDKDEDIKYEAKVKLGSLVDRSGNMKPKVFLAMLEIFVKEPKYQESLRKLC